MSGFTPALSKLNSNIACIELKRPESANRLELEDLNIIKYYVQKCEMDQQTKVVIFSSQGKYFSSGLDFHALKKLELSRKINSETLLEEMVNVVANTKLITMASIQGPVFGGATDLILACDLRIGSHDCFIKMPAAKIGLPLYSSLIERYVSNLGLAQAKRLILTGVEVQADELLTIGFLTELVSTENLKTSTYQLAHTIAEFPFEPLSAMKKYLNSISSFNQNDRAKSKEELVSAFDIRGISRRIFVDEN
jgi:enoyl-CoA hydratase/carnithine racemase